MNDCVVGLDDEIVVNGRTSTIRREQKTGNLFSFRSTDGATLGQRSATYHVVIEEQTFEISREDHAALLGISLVN